MSVYSTAIIEVRTLDLATKGLKGIAGSFARLGAGLMQMGLAMSVAITAPIVGIGMAATKTITDLDQQMRKIQTITKQTDASLSTLRDSFVKMSTDITKTVDTAPKLAEAYYDIAQRGFSAADATQILGVATKAATAGITDTLVAAKAIGGVLNAYNLSARSATHVSDVMFRTIDRGVVTYAELTQQMGDFLPAAAMVGIKFEEAMAAMATITMMNVPVAEAATQIARLILSITAPTNKAADAAAYWGVEMGQTALATKGLVGWIKDLNEKVGGNIQAVKDITGEQRAWKGALNLMSGDVRRFVTNLEYTTDAAGATESAFTKMIKSFAARFASFKNSINALAISIGEVLLPTIMRIVDAAKPFIDAFDLLPDSTKSAAVSLALMVAVLGPLAFLAGIVILPLARLLNIFLSIAGLALKLSGIGKLLGWIVGLPAVAGAITALKGAAAAAAPWLFWLAAAVGLLYVAWRNNWLGIRNWTKKAADFIKTKLAEIDLEKIKAKIVAFFSSLSKIDVKQTFINLKDAIQKKLDEIKADPGKFLQKLLADIQVWFDKAVVDLKVFAGRIWTGITAAFTTIKESETVQVIVTAIQEWFDQAKVDTKQFVGNVVADIKDWIGKIDVAETWKTLKTNVQQWFDQAIIDLGTFASNIWTGIKTAFTTIKESETVQVVVTAIQTWFDQAKIDTATFVGNIIDNIKTELEALRADPEPFVHAVLDGIQAFVDAAVVDFTKFVSNLGASFSTAMASSELTTTVAALIGKTINDALDLWLSTITWPNIFELFGKFLGSSSTAAVNNTTNVARATSAITTWLTEAIESVDWTTLGADASKRFTDAILAYFAISKLAGDVIGILWTGLKTGDLESAGEELFNSFKKGFVDTVAINLAVQTMHIELIKAIANIFDLYETGKRAAIDFFAGFVGGIAGELGMPAKLVEGMVRRVLAIVTKTKIEIPELSGGTTFGLDESVASAQTVGTEFSAGFASGITAGEPDVVIAANEIGLVAVQALRDTLDARSPSKITMAIGEDTGEGFWIGLLKAATAGNWNEFYRILSTGADKLLGDQLTKFEQWSAQVAAANRRALVAQMVGSGAANIYSPWIEQMLAYGQERSAQLQKEKAEAIQTSQEAADAARAAWEAEFSKLKTKIQGMFDKGISVSINLGDLRPGGGDPLAAGANGPFEAIYRIQDIAIRAQAPGIETQKWMDMYGLGQDVAAEIVKKFQMGLWDETVIPYIDFQKIIDIARLEEAATNSLAGIANRVTRAALAQGVSPESIQKTLIGMGIVKPTADSIAPIVQPLADATKTAFDSALGAVADGRALEILLTGTGNAIPTLPPLVPGIVAAFDQQVVDNASQLRTSGGKLWTKLEDGIVEKAKTSGVLYGAVYEMVENILASELAQ